MSDQNFDNIEDEIIDVENIDEGEYQILDLTKDYDEDDKQESD